MKFLEKLSSSLVFFDGAMGTQLIARGLKPGETPESWNVTHPDDVLAVHSAYLQAGCQVITSNTFGAHPLKWGAEQAAQYVRAALAAARKAADGCGHDAYVALDLGPTGRLMKPFGDLSFEDAYASFAGMVDAGKEQADLVLVETVSDLFEARAAVLAAKEHCDLPVVVTMSLDEKGMLLTGSDIGAIVTMLEGLGVDALGFNCGLGPKEMAAFVQQACQMARVPVIACPNAGLPVSVNGKAVYQLAPDLFASYMEELWRMGAKGLGGCCGTTPEHLMQMTRLLSGRQPQTVSHRCAGRVSSFARALDLKDGPFLVGERLNPTGKPRMKQALKDGDMDFMLLEAVRQTDAGAQLLDVNVGLPGLDEKQAMEKLVDALQGVTDVPLQLDSTRPDVLEAGLRRYTGCALINSVNGTQESMDGIFPLVKKYGACVVALTLDESGIPETVQGRVDIALRIIEEAKKYGIGSERIVVDPLCMAVSAVKGGARATLGALGMLSSLGINTTLGVSNVSFGLPDRPRLNAAMLTAALGLGLTLAIVNPLNAQMMDAWYTFLALTGRDEGCRGYIERFGTETAAPAQAPQSDMTLEEAVIRGLKGSAAALTDELLGAMSPMEIIDTALVPALNRVGSAFEKGEMFLPQLLMSADAAGAGFERVRQALRVENGETGGKGRVVLATVQGDIHDIGKNIVKALLENYGFDVIDLGKDVPPETVVQAVRESGAKLVGLSALMTTTVDAMARTIRLLREGCSCGIMVGGAVLTHDYAMSIGADFYAKDAMQSVRYAQKTYGA